MKRTLLSLVAATFVAATAMAQEPVKVTPLGKVKAQTSEFIKNTLPEGIVPVSPNKMTNLNKRINVAKAGEEPAEEELEINEKSLTFLNASSSQIHIAPILQGAGHQLGFYTLFEKNHVARLAGNKITKIQFFGPLGSPTKSKVVIYKATDEGFKPVYSADASLKETAFNTVACDYTIEGDGDLLIGYESLLAESSQSSQNGGVGPSFCATGATSMGLVVSYNGQLFNMSSGFYQDAYATLPLLVTTEGTASMKANDAGNVFIDPVRGDLATANERQVLTSGVFQSFGTDSITSLVCEYEIDGEKFELPFNLGEQKIGMFQNVSFTFPAMLSQQIGRSKAKFSIKTVNGIVDEYPSDNSCEASVVTYQHGSPRTAVVEEFTSTYCGYCPRGIVGMEKAKSTFKEGLVVLCGHADMSSTQVDPMTCKEYQAVVQTFAPGLPSATLNRQYLGLDPYFGSQGDILQDIMPIATGTCEAAMSVTSKNANLGKRIDVTANVKFNIPVKAGQYGIAYVVTEDKVEGYEQLNYYYGQNLSQYPDDLQFLSSEGTPKGEYAWYKPEFNDVVRYINSPDGSTETDLVPALDIDAAHTHSTTLVLPSGFTTKGRTINVTALLVDQETGIIVTAAQCPLNGEGFTVGIDEVESATGVADITAGNGAFSVKADGAKAAVYTLDGKLVSSATVNGSASLPTFGKGAFIIRVEKGGNVVSKKAVF